jgi:site-specific DNA-methyltransferase (adenine-specific)
MTLKLNTVHQGDCIELMQSIEDKSVDMVLCDLPYGSTNCKWDVVIPFADLWAAYARIVKDNGAILLFGSGLFFCDLCLSNRKMYRYDLVWEKERPTNIFFMKKQFGKVHEKIAVFYTRQPTYNPIMEDRNFRTMGVGDLKVSKTHKNQSYKYSEGYDKTKVYPRSVIKINRDTLKGALHPTQKPLALCEYLIRTYTYGGDVVLDTCAGSGTTALACKNLGRDFIAIEKEKKYCQIARTRIGEI